MCVCVHSRINYVQLDKDYNIKKNSCRKRKCTTTRYVPTYVRTQPCEYTHINVTRVCRALNRFKSSESDTIWCLVCQQQRHYVRVMGRLRGIDPPFSRHWKKNLDFRPPFFKVPAKNIDFRPPPPPFFFRILRRKVDFRPIFSPRHRL